MQEDLIAVVNKVQDTFNAVGGEAVDLPQIVTVGSQSSGKSSVLENIVGKDFLPRGSGIVTRRPLVLQLIHLQPQSTPSSTTSSQNPPHANGTQPFPTTQQQQPPREYAEFLHTNQRFYDFDDVRTEIENETRRVTGNNKGISKLPIHLKLYSERVLNLTLVDLPGLTKIPVGDQPSDIERQIRDLVRDYISKPNCIILAISPANVDLANSESLKLARSVDPSGRRTIGVLTKLDLMDQGTNALDILTGRVYPLKLGFIGVVNRSQHDIQEHKAMQDALDAEEDFFKQHHGYRNIAHRCGTRFLAKTLNQVLLSHIREKLPEMKARLNTLMGQTQQELAQFGDVAFMGEQHRGTLILKLMTQFARDFVASIDGTSVDISTKELCGGARIYHIFHDVFGHALESINPTHNLTNQDIRTAVRNSSGPRPSLFVPEIAFELLIKPQIKLLEPPSLRCVEMVYEELVRTCHGCSSTELSRYPRLHAQLIEVVSELLRERLGPTSEYVQSLISIQTSYINTNHPMFVNATANFAKEQQQQAEQRKFPPPKRKTPEIKKNDGDDATEEGSENADDSAPSNILFPDNKQINHRSSFSEGQRSGFKKHHSTGSSSSLAPHRPVSPVGLNPAINSGGAPAKDSFLTYFFGGNNQNGPPNGRPTRPGQLSDLSEERSDNPLAGRRGLEGSAAAFDMKSLDRHITEPQYEEEYQAVHSSREDMETALLQSLIAAYFGIVRQTIQDVVPKAVMHLLVNFSRESVQNRLVASLYREAKFDELLYEDENLTAERNRIKGLLDAYKEAFRTLSDVL